MSEKFTYDVFISLASKDKTVVHPLAERLQGEPFAALNVHEVRRWTIGGS